MFFSRAVMISSFITVNTKCFTEQKLEVLADATTLSCAEW